MRDDRELLREYVEEASEEAFRALVDRHAGMVHGAALRLVQDVALADEIAQAVFILLARKASTLRDKAVPHDRALDLSQFSEFSQPVLVPKKSDPF
jgi:DNA-directed RNA polymerase specialized sigma24 family protein